MTVRSTPWGHAQVNPSARPAEPVVDAFVREAEAALHDAELAAHEDPRMSTDVLLAIDPVAPSSDLRARLMQTLDTTNRFDDLEARVAELADVSIERARAMLCDVDAAHVWTPGPSEGVELFHFEGGERVRNAVTGFVRVAPGVSFPDHGHVGDESVLVLTGVLETTDGERFVGGELALMPAGSHHGFRSAGRGRLVLMTVVQGGVTIGDALIAPGDPRG